MEKNLNKSKIELINSCGPFNHSVWRAGDLKFTNEEVLEGRAEFLAKKIREIITKSFTHKQIQGMSIADVGCYDGWLLHELSDLPFRRMVGIEPRRKNIVKGTRVRRLLGIKTRVRSQIGSIEMLGREKFDIVLCIGTLHHVESISTAIKRLDVSTRKLLILDSLVVSSSYITSEFRRDIEMKDIIYRFEEQLCGITGQKYESSYYDGSAAETAVISVPSTETLIMHLQLLGYKPIHIAAGPEDFKRAMKKHTRPAEEALLYGIKNPVKKNEALGNFIKNYEKGMVFVALPQTLVAPLYEQFVLGLRNVAMPRDARSIADYIGGDSKKLGIIQKKFKDEHRREILRNIRFNPKDKIAFEYGKTLYSDKKYSAAAAVLRGITEHPNADWRCTYRSFYLLSLIYGKTGKTARGGYYKGLCKASHSNFPLLAAY